MALESIQFVIFGRSYCHLCDELKDSVVKVSGTTDFTIETFDVDADPLLLARYDELVPVLGIRRPDRSIRYICHYVLDSNALAEAVTGVARDDLAPI